MTADSMLEFDPMRAVCLEMCDFSGVVRRIRIQRKKKQTFNNNGNPVEVIRI